MAKKKEDRVDYQLRLMSASEKSECLTYFAHQDEEAFFTWCRKKGIIRDAGKVAEEMIDEFWTEYVEYYESVDEDELYESFYEGKSYCGDESYILDHVESMSRDLADAFSSPDLTPDCRLRYLKKALTDPPSGCLDEYGTGFEGILLAIPGNKRETIQASLPILEEHGENTIIKSLFLKVLKDEKGYKLYRAEHLSTPEEYGELIRHFQDMKDRVNVERFCWKAIESECTNRDIVKSLYRVLSDRDDIEGIVRMVDTMGWQYFTHDYNRTYEYLWADLEELRPTFAFNLLSSWFFVPRERLFSFSRRFSDSSLEIREHFHHRYFDLVRLANTCGIKGIEEKALTYAKKTSSLDWVWILSYLGRHKEAAAFIKENWQDIERKDDWDLFMLMFADFYPDIANTCLKSIIYHSITQLKVYETVADSLLPRYRETVMEKLTSVQSWKDYSEEFIASYGKRRKLMPFVRDLLE